MAIVVTKPGKHLNDRKFHAVCEKCTCEYDYMFADTEMTGGAGPNPIWLGTRCPTCETKIKHSKCTEVVEQTIAQEEDIPK